MLTPTSFKKKLLLLILCFCTIHGTTTYASTLNCSTAVNISIPVNECQALLDLYDSTNGSGWSNNSRRDTDTDASTWHGVGTDGANVTSLSLSNNNLSGTLPGSLSGLSLIQEFDIGTNEVGGVLPESLSSRTAIGQFNVKSNNLEGTLPAARSIRPNIYYINLSNNQFEGTLPAARSAWSNMGYFYANNNQLQGTLPAARSAWVGMWILNIADNQFEGSLPGSRSTWTFLRYFYAQNNLLSGPLPSSRSTLVNMFDFDVSNNLLSGLIPSSRYISWPNPLMIYIQSDDNCMQTTGYSTGMLSWLSANAIHTPQNDCTIIPPVILSPTSGQILTTGNILVSGTGQAGNTISVTLSGTTLAATINSSGLRSILFNNLADGSYTASAFQTDSLSSYDSITVTSSFSIAIPTTTAPTPTPSAGGGGGGGSSQKDSCPDGDKTASYYDGSCGENGETIILQQTKDKPPQVEGTSAAESAKCEIIKSYETTMTDIRGMSYENAVILMLRHCMIEGYGNKGKIYGGGKIAKYGEIYKIAYRFIGEPIDVTTVQNHRSDPYRIELEKLGLLKGITIPSDSSKPIPPSVFYAIIKNILDYKSINDPLLEKELRNDIKSSLITRRGKVALVFEKIIKYSE